jgi:hypothetical protein
MNETIEDGIGQGWVADGLVPVLDWQLACDDCGGAAMAVFEDFQKITPLRGGEDCKAPVVNDQNLHAGDGFENALMAPITTGEGKGFEHARGALIEDRSPVTTSLVASFVPSLQRFCIAANVSYHGGGNNVQQPLGF